MSCTSVLLQALGKINQSLSAGSRGFAGVPLRQRGDGLHRWTRGWAAEAQEQSSSEVPDGAQSTQLCWETSATHMSPFPTH